MPSDCMEEPLQVFLKCSFGELAGAAPWGSACPGPARQWPGLEGPSDVEDILQGLRVEGPIPELQVPGSPWMLLFWNTTNRAVESQTGLKQAAQNFLSLSLGGASLSQSSSSIGTFQHCQKSNSNKGNCLRHLTTITIFFIQIKTVKPGLIV